MGFLDDLELFWNMLPEEEQRAVKSVARKLGVAGVQAAKARAARPPAGKRARRPPPPPGATPIDLGRDAKLVGVTWPCSLAALKAAYRARALELHPDRPTGDRAKFQAMKAAYERLAKHATA